MPGTKEGSARAAATNIRRYGKDFYKRIGHLGGSSPKTKPSGFAAMPRWKRVAASKKGGAISVRKKSDAKRV
jgi:hypothetical protein